MLGSLCLDVKVRRWNMILQRLTVEVDLDVGILFRDDGKVGKPRLHLTFADIAKPSCPWNSRRACQRVKITIWRVRSFSLVSDDANLNCSSNLALELVRALCLDRLDYCSSQSALESLGAGWVLRPPLFGLASTRHHGTWPFASSSFPRKLGLFRVRSLQLLGSRDDSLEICFASLACDHSPHVRPITRWYGYCKPS